MSWSSSNRRSQLPDNWDPLRKEILKRDSYSCQWIIGEGYARAGQKCGKPANQVDHIKRGNNHSKSNLQSLCEDHHSLKSSQEGSEARQEARDKKMKAIRRPDEVNSGILDSPRPKPKFKGF